MEDLKVEESTIPAEDKSVFCIQSEIRQRGKQ
jgi:hypothetical protein